MSTNIRSYPVMSQAQTFPRFLRLSEPAEAAVARRDSTIATYYHAVERVIAAMHQRLEEPLTLPDMAEIALLSPYHFNRIFRYITGIPPLKFQAALRLQAAKRLLVTTDLSVTEICFAVGYNSLASFTRNFTELVGLSPRQLRCLADELHVDDLQSLDVSTDLSDEQPSACAGWTLRGAVTTVVPFSGLIMIGLFAAPIPESLPVGCAVLSEPGSFQIHDVPGGEYYLLAAAFDRSEQGLAGLLQDTPTLVGMAHTAIEVPASGPVVDADVLLRPVHPTDPPILVALPFLLNERIKTCIVDDDELDRLS
ncbi:MAG TPA: helix-turn-helix transcriptional regulator [Herpetosiphonaceae bacterium]